MADVVINSGTQEQVALDLFRITVGYLPKGQGSDVDSMLSHYARCLKTVRLVGQ